MDWKSKLVKKVNARFAVYILAVPIILFYTLALTGCISNSPGIPDIYLVTIKSVNSISGLAGDFTVRVGYFGMCASTSGQNLTCSPTRGLSATQLTSSFLATDKNITTTLFILATMFQSQIFLFFLAIAGFIFLLALLFVLILDRNVKRSNHGPKAVQRQQFLGKASKSLVWMSVALGLAASLGTHPAVAALQLFSEVVEDKVLINDGTALLTLQWLTVGLSFAFALGINAVWSQSGGSSNSTSLEFSPSKAGSGEEIIL